MDLETRDWQMKGGMITVLLMRGDTMTKATYKRKLLIVGGLLTVSEAESMNITMAAG